MTPLEFSQILQYPPEFQLILLYLLEFFIDLLNKGGYNFFLENPILRRFSLEFFSVNFIFLGKRLLLLFAEIIVFNRIYNTTSVFVVVVLFCFFNQAFSTLFLMYHKATACNVIPDIVEVVNLLQTILSCCNTNADGKIFISYSPLFSFAC